MGGVETDMTVHEKNARVFKAFCDPNRLKILDMLRNGEQCAYALLEVLKIGQPTLSHHMKILCDARLVNGRKEGKWTHYSISEKGVEQAKECLRQLTTLDVSQNTALSNLNCSNNQLSELNVAKNPKLQTLSCANNQLTALDIEKNTSLSTLYCNNNQLAELSVSKNTMLKRLYCYANRMSELDVTKNLELTALYCGAQTTDGSTSQTLKLTLPAELKDVWDKGASVSTGWNDHVDVKTDGMNGSHGGFEDGGTVEW